MRLIGAELVDWGHIVVPPEDLRRIREPCPLCGHPTGDCCSGRTYGDGDEEEDAGGT